MSPENILSISNTIILALTGYIVFLYTREAQKSNRIRLRPVLNLYLRGEENNEYFALRNISETTAYNIQIHRLEIEQYIYEFNFKEPNIILEANGDEKRVFFPIRKMQNGDIQSTSTHYLKLHFSPKTLDTEALEKANKLYLPFLINYNNINGENFYSVFKIYTKHPIVDDFVVEFAKSGEGKCDIKKAKNICETMERLEISY